MVSKGAIIYDVDGTIDENINKILTQIAKTDNNTIVFFLPLYSINKVGLFYYGNVDNLLKYLNSIGKIFYKDENFKISNMFFEPGKYLRGLLFEKLKLHSSPYRLSLSNNEIIIKMGEWMFVGIIKPRKNKKRISFEWEEKINIKRIEPLGVEIKKEQKLEGKFVYFINYKPDIEKMLINILKKVDMNVVFMVIKGIVCLCFCFEEDYEKISKYIHEIDPMKKERCIGLDFILNAFFETGKFISYHVFLTNIDMFYELKATKEDIVLIAKIGDEIIRGKIVQDKISLVETTPVV